MAYAKQTVKRTTTKTKAKANKVKRTSNAKPNSTRTKKTRL